MKNTSSLQGAAFDLHSLDTLKRSVKANAQGGLKAVAKQMEGLFVQMVLKSMRDASFKDGLFNSQQTEMFTAMYDQQIAQNIAERGNIGLADMMVRQLGGQPETPPAATGYVPLTSGRRGNVPLLHYAGIMPQNDNKRSGEIIRQRQTNDSFIKRLMAPALDVAKKTGIPHQLIIAQAALESAWGNREITTQDGKPSYNLFAIKATPGWKGETTEITTTEYINGVAQKVRSSFRVYASYSEALVDYTKLLMTNSRYQDVAKLKNPEMAAYALQNGGYASDPDYAKKIISIMHYIKSNVNQAINDYSVDLSKIF